MSADLNKKTLRHFYCRDALWQCFERMSEDFDRGIDDLVNEAMRLFAREKGYLPAENEARPATMRQAPSRPPPLPPPGRAAGSQPSYRHVPTPPPLPPQAAASMGYGAAAAAAAPGAAGGQGAPPIYLIFQNQKYLIDKEQFIIGRGAKSSDLAIRDGNISRKHAAVIRRNGAYYIKDLGSTNGIDFGGVRVDNKKIEEGDTFSICDYQLKFTFR